MIDKGYCSYYNVFMRDCHDLSAMRFQGHRVLMVERSPVIFHRVVVVLFLFLFVLLSVDSRVWGQSISSVRSFDGGVTPLFTLPGPGSLYIDNQGTQGFLYNPGNNFQSFSFRNPTTGQAWRGVVPPPGRNFLLGLSKAPTRLVLRSFFQLLLAKQLPCLRSNQISSTISPKQTPFSEDPGQFPSSSLLPSFSIHKSLAIFFNPAREHSPVARRARADSGQRFEGCLD